MRGEETCEDLEERFAGHFAGSGGGDGEEEEGACEAVHIEKKAGEEQGV